MAKKNPHVLLARVESQRRSEEYVDMIVTAGCLSLSLVAEKTRYAHGLRSKLFYELHMAQYQQAMKAERGTRIFHLGESQTLAERSAEEADGAGDPLGRLFVEMNISGLIFPELRQFSEALTRSHLVRIKAEKIAAADVTTEENRQRAWRISMNTTIHRIRIVMKYMSHAAFAKETVKDELNRLRSNPRFLKQKEAQITVIEAEKFLQE